tara:strand:- start:96 stop:416 length:321 start_codon:yes stop_codon:yes gene_type:complete
MAGERNTIDAIQSLASGVEFRVHIAMDGTETIVFENLNGVTEPTTDEIAAEVIRLQAAYDALNYSRTRKAQYDLLNQDEMRYDDLVNSTTTWRDGIAAIKVAHPKP